jgi:ATP-dependent Lon protease
MCVKKQKRLLKNGHNIIKEIIMTELETYTLMPLRDVVVFPYMVMPLFVGRKESIQALDLAMEQGKQIFLLAQKDGALEKPAKKDLYEVGVVATILQMLRLPDGTVKALVEGYKRAEVKKITRKNGCQHADVTVLAEKEPKKTREITALMRNVMKLFESYIKNKSKLPAEVLVSLKNIEEPGRLADCITSHLAIKVDIKQNLLSTKTPKKRLEKLNDILTAEIEMVEVEKRVKDRVQDQVGRSQRQYILNEKLKALHKEMEDTGEGAPYDDLGALEEKINNCSMSEEALTKAKSELAKLKSMPSMSAEANVSRTYLDWLTTVPWDNKSNINYDLTAAEETLDADHYGLEKVKERIIEYLAVQKRVDKLKGPILCLVGPPGVGKTSLGQSIANATGREFIRISLGGVRDEAEIRGHRRTYVGAMPGKIIQKMSKAKVKNPLFMLDEVDKMSMDFRGDPASALLEVLDPEQNNSFNDHYLEVDYDLSDAMFITTANSLDMPAPLLDRMEIIRLAGYTEDEKVQIAERYLVPRQIEANGLAKTELSIDKAALRDIIRYYTRESGVRNLEREISKIARKVVYDILQSAEKKKNLSKVKVSTKSLEKYLGVKRHRFGLAESNNRAGQVTGLAWTEVGGELLTIEAQIMTGKGVSQYTGSLGDVMQESIKTAMTVIRARSAELNVKDDFFQTHDFHVHVPEGATPKDGPSAGVGMCTALISCITGIAVRADVAMTGEITLRGEVLPIGGLKEKLLAALRGGIKTVLIPHDNERDLKEIPDNVKEGLKIIPVKWVDQVLNVALVKPLDAILSASEDMLPIVAKKRKSRKKTDEVAH